MKFDALYLKCLLATIFWLALYIFMPPSNIINRFGIDSLFQARAILTSPKLHPRIKIFAYDDRTVAKLQSFDLALPDWSLVLSALDKMSPHAIMIDKLFDNPDYQEQSANEFAHTLRTLATPVVPIIFGTEKAIAFRNELSAPALEKSIISESTVLDQKKTRFVYGPHPQLIPGIRKLGHALYDPSGFVPVLLKGKHATYTHWSFAARDDFKVDGERLFFGNEQVPLHRDGQVLVNIQEYETYRNRIYSMTTLMEKARAGEPISVVKPGDIVVILPAMYTGNTDWRETPLGAFQGGVIMVAMLNSVLSGKWISVYDWGGVTILLAGLFPLLFIRVSMMRLVAVAVTSILSLVILIFTIFVILNVAVYWLQPFLAVLSSFILLFHHKSTLIWVQKLRMQRELETAQLVQNSFFPESNSTTLNIESLHMPASECGGDWWGHFKIPSGHEFFIIADATGHGASAALVTAMTFATFSSIKLLMLEDQELVFTPKEICEHLNGVFCESMGGLASMTCFVGRFDPGLKTMTYCNRGHVFPFLLGSNSEKKVLSSVKAGGDPIGIFPDGKFTDSVIELSKGDKIVFYTDGIYENLPSFNLKTFRKTINLSFDQSPADQLATLTSAYLSAKVDDTQEDDVTLVIVQCL